MTPAELREHIELSRRSSAGMPAELTAPHVALADLCIAYFAAVDAADVSELTEEALTAAGERIEEAERQLREALGLGPSEPDAQLASALREVGSEHTPPADWQQRVLAEATRDDTVTTEHVARKHWDADTSARGESSDYIEGWNDAVDAFERRFLPSPYPDRAEGDRSLTIRSTT